jgi:hypothetical protein
MCVRMETKRAALGFVDKTRSAFGFLKEFGFREIGAEESIVRYATDRVFLNVYHGRSSYELGIELGAMGDATEASGHSMSALIRLQNPEQAARFRNAIATNPIEVETAVMNLAKLVDTYGGQALRGDPVVFATLDRQRKEWAAEYAADVAYAQVQTAADEAFRRHDYTEAARLYVQVQGKLTPTELKKLEYAKKHCGR